MQSNVLMPHHPSHLFIPDPVSSAARVLQIHAVQMLYALLQSSLQKHQLLRRFSRNPNSRADRVSPRFVPVFFLGRMCIRRGYLFKDLSLLFSEVYYVLRVHRVASASTLSSLATYKARYLFIVAGPLVQFWSE